MNKGNSKQGRLWINSLNVHSSRFHSPINMKTNQRYKLPSENLPTSLHEKNYKKWKNPKPHWHPQLPITQPKNLGIFMKSKTFT
jgi:hypothetical protein